MKLVAELAERDRAPLSAAFIRAACSSARLPAEELADAKLAKRPLEDPQAKDHVPWLKERCCLG